MHHELRGTPYPEGCQLPPEVVVLCTTLSVRHIGAMGLDTSAKKNNVSSQQVAVKNGAALLLKFAGHTVLRLLSWTEDMTSFCGKSILRTFRLDKRRLLAQTLNS